MSDNDGGPAFPFVSHGGWHEHQSCDQGMSLRDYFAGQSQSTARRIVDNLSTCECLLLIGKEDGEDSDQQSKLEVLTTDDWIQAIAIMAYRIADTKLMVREKY